MQRLSESNHDFNDEILRIAASELPKGYAITHAFAGSSGVGLFGGEYSRMIAYGSDGTIVRLHSAGATLGTPSKPPINVASELGIAYVGDDTRDALEGFSYTAEGGLVAGVGVTVPGKAISRASDLVAAALAGRHEDWLDALSKSAPGTILFVSAGIQAGVSIEASYTVSEQGILNVRFSSGPVDARFGHDIGAALSYVESGKGDASISWTHTLDGRQIDIETTYELVTSTRDGSTLINERTIATDENGQRLTNGSLRDMGLIPETQRRWIKDGNYIENPNECFAAGTLITMADGSLKSIEDIQKGDRILSYDEEGNVLPGIVNETMTNEVRCILDLHGTQITPGHSTYCSEGIFEGKHVPVIDILRTDGALILADGTKVRAATGKQVGSLDDRLVYCVLTRQMEDARFRHTGSHWMRYGTRVIMEDGSDVSIRELVEAVGGQLNQDGIIEMPDGTSGPFNWSAIQPMFPKPEDYVLSRSGLSLEDIYAADEWESAPSELMAPIDQAVPSVSRHEGSSIGAALGAKLPDWRH